MDPATSITIIAALIAVAALLIVTLVQVSSLRKKLVEGNVEQAAEAA